MSFLYRCCGSWYSWFAVDRAGQRHHDAPGAGKHLYLPAVRFRRWALEAGVNVPYLGETDAGFLYLPGGSGATLGLIIIAIFPASRRADYRRGKTGAAVRYLPGLTNLSCLAC